MELFLIRHLQTEYNRQGILQGSQDLPILKPATEVMDQIEHNKKRLSDLAPFDAILISEYQRTRMTAECYGFNSELKVEKLLNELNFGIYEGRTKAELIADHLELWENNPEQIILGEPLTNLVERLKQFINNYRHCQRVLVFGHGSWSRAMYSLVTYGHINKMNQMTIANNDLLQLTIK